jgi:hypothetical protein
MPNGMGRLGPADPRRCVPVSAHNHRPQQERPDRLRRKLPGTRPASACDNPSPTRATLRRTVGDWEPCIQTRWRCRCRLPIKSDTMVHHLPLAGQIGGSPESVRLKDEPARDPGCLGLCLLSSDRKWDRTTRLLGGAPSCRQSADVAQKDRRTDPVPRRMTFHSDCPKQLLRASARRRTADSPHRIEGIGVESSAENGGRVILLPDNDFDSDPGQGKSVTESRKKRQTGGRPGGFARHGYASTPRES